MAKKVDPNKFRNEYIDFEVKQIKKDKLMEERIKSMQHRNSLLPRLINKLNDEALDDVFAMRLDKLRQSKVSHTALKKESLFDSMMTR